MRLVILKTSGHFGHEGRPGRVGGSLPSGQHANDPEYQLRRERAREALRAYRARQRAAQQQQPVQVPTAQQQTEQLQERYNIAEMFASMPATITDDQVAFGYMNPTLFERLQRDYPMLTDDMIKRMFYIKDMQGIVSLSSEGLKCEWTDAQGTNIGYQVISAEGTDAHFSYLRMYGNSQGQDIGMPLVIKQVAMCKMLGFKTVSMNADISIGKYAWAKPGVEYADPDRSEVCRARYENWVRRVAGAWLSRSQLDKLRADTSWKSFEHPWQWAKYDVPGVHIPSHTLGNSDVKEGMYPIGKAFMLTDVDYGGHGNWDAVIDLSKIGF